MAPRGGHGAQTKTQHCRTRDREQRLGAREKKVQEAVVRYKESKPGACAGRWLGREAHYVVGVDGWGNAARVCGTQAAGEGRAGRRTWRGMKGKKFEGRGRANGSAGRS